MWFIIEWFVTGFFIIGFVSQIMIPIVTGTKWFPLLRRRDLTKQATEVREGLERAVMERELEVLRKQMDDAIAAQAASVNPTTSTTEAISASEQQEQSQS